MLSLPVGPRAPSLSNESRNSKAEIRNADGPLPGCTDEPVSTDDPKATQKVLVDSKFRLQDLPPGIVPLPRIDGYEILGVLGRGGMGVVYKAQETKLQRIVALKMILAGAHASPHDLQRFQTEARAVAKLQHPNIVQIHDINQQDGQNYFSLEYVDGGTLAKQIDSRPHAHQQAARLVELLARAMYYAHEHNIVHRDLKPGNILLTADGTPKITDFGVAKQLDSEQGNTRSGAIVGTPTYMAPEQARGESKKMGPAADIYSLGVILYEMLTGGPPFKGDTPIDILFQIAEDEPVPPTHLQPKVPRDLEIICLKCLEKDPNRRYLTARALANDLARFLADEPILARPLSTWERGWRWIKRHKAMTAVAAAILIALSGIVAGGFQSRSSEQRRWQEKVDAVWKQISDAEATVKDNKAWENAPGLVADIRTRLDSDSDLETVHSEIEKKLRTLEARFQGREFHRNFLARLDDSMFDLGFALGDQKKLAPWQDQAWKILGLIGIDRGKVEIRQLDYELSVEERQGIERGSYELLLTLAALQKGYDSLAVLDLARALPFLSRSYHLLRASHFEQIGQANDAGRERELARDQPLTAIDHFLAGNESYARGKIQKAAEEYANALQLRPDYYWARYYLALCDIRLGEPALARDNLTACASQKPGIVLVYLMRGYAEGQLKNYEAAERDFQIALAMNPDEKALYVLYNNRGVMLLQQKERFQEALQDLHQAIRLQPKTYHAYASLADAYAQQRNWNEALQNIDQAIAIADDAGTKGALYRYRARYHAELKLDAAALADLEKEIELESSVGVPSTKAYLLRGQLLKKNGQLEEALKSFDAAHKIQPGLEETLRGRADILYQKKKYAEAIQALSLIRQPTAPDYKTRGLARAMTSDSQGAAEDYSRALELENRTADSMTKTANIVWLLTHRGQAYLSCQADRPALRDFEEALRLDAKNREALGGRGLARVRLGQIDTGLQDARKSLSLGSPSARVCYNAGRIYAQAAAIIDTHEPRTRQSVDKKVQYQARAIELVRQALELLPEGQRSIFWQDTVGRDACLSSIHRMPAFSRLEEKYATKTSAALTTSAAK
jgi:serine/threonine protein kinase/tetratricopeptide (TPR) repeat protein